LPEGDHLEKMQVLKHPSNNLVAQHAVEQHFAV